MKQWRAESNTQKGDRGEGDSLGLCLENLRRLQNKTQSSLAKTLGIGQTALSHMERRDDILLSTLQAYIEALGGQLYIAATFPDGEAISLVGESHLSPRETPTAFSEPLEDDQLSLPDIPGPSRTSRSRDVIFSIHPVHAEKILDGSKTVELRRRFTAVKPGTLALIYSTSPTSALTGSAYIEEVERLAVSDLWEKHRSAACLQRSEFEDYFAGRAKGYAIVLSSAKPLARPVGLPELRKRFGFEPPQSYQYIRPDMRSLVM